MIINLCKWMETLDGSRPVLQYNLAGSHDCATQYVQFSHITKCQDLNIYEQLCIGIRLLDARVESEGDRLKMVHAVAKAFNSPSVFAEQMDMSDVLAHCYRFLSENPYETIILMFKNDSSGADEECFDNLYNTYISENEDKWFLENRIPTLDEVRGRIVLLNRCNANQSSNTGINCTQWEDQGETVPEPLSLETGGEHSETFVIQDRYKYKPEEKWNDCVRPFLDEASEFSGNYIINYLSTAGGIKGPFKNSLYINPQFIEYPLNKNYYYGIICCDFPSRDLTRKIIETNL